MARSARRAARRRAESEPVAITVPEASSAVTVEPDSTSASRAWADGFGLVATRSLQIIIVVVLAAGLVFGLRALTTVAIPILLALIFASTFAPVTRWLRGRRVPPALAAVIVLLGILLMFAGLAWLVAWAVYDQWDELREQALAGFTQLTEWVQTLPFAPSAEQLQEWQANIVSFLTEFVTSSQFGSGAIAGVSAVANFLTGFVLMIVVLFFFLKDGPAIWQFVLRPFHGEGRARAERIGRTTVVTFGSYVRGTATVAAADAIGIFIGLVILQVPLALPLGVVVFLLSFIPLVGAVVAGILAALVALVTQGWVAALIVVGIVVLVNQLEGNFLQPVVMGRALKLHALVILLALTIGTVLAGILGAVLAVPLAAVAWGIVKVWDGPDLPARWARPTAVELAAKD